MSIFGKNSKVNNILLDWSFNLSYFNSSCSTTTIKRLFSTMKIIKTKLRNKIEDEFLANNMNIHIENENAENFSFDSNIDEYSRIWTREGQSFIL